HLPAIIAGLTKLENASIWRGENNLRFDDKSALKILGDRNVLIETPLIKELMDEGRIKGKIEGKIEDIISVMGFRFGAVSEELGLRLKQISDTDRLSELLRVAVTCKSTKAFERELPIA
ncbi:MAG: hypothetical protein O3A00_12490, partial [Planctomycetota bacterium]|nr:hypothetical protein [Planctomycetota bacterium]